MLTLIYSAGLLKADGSSTCTTVWNVDICMYICIYIYIYT